MEIFLYVSGIGVLALLATHMVDYALESTRRSLANPQGGAVRNAAAASGDVLTPREVVEEYDRAA
jgi:hypothetical protein